MKKLILFIVFMLFLDCNKSRIWKPVEFELLNLHTNSSSTGQFFLGSGRFGAEDYYLGFIKKGNGIERLRVPTDYCTVFYTEGTPYIEAAALVDRVIEATCLGEGAACKRTIIDTIVTERNGKQIVSYRYNCNLYIPKGSIIKNFNLK